MTPRDPFRGIRWKAVNMRIIQSVILKLFGLAVLAGAGLFVAMRFSAALRAFAFVHGRMLFHSHYFFLGAALLGLIAIIALLPVARKRSRNTISFPGIRGDVTIELDSVEANLARIVGKMTEVKKIRVKVTPSEDNRRAVVSGDVLMYKGTSAIPAHEIANRIAERLNDAAVNILGVEEVTKVDLNVRDIIVDAKRLAVEPGREPVAKIAEPPAVPTATVESVVPAEPEKAAGPDLALGAFDAAPAEREEKMEVVESECGFSPVEETPSAAEASATSEQTHAVERTGFEALTLDTDEPGEKEAPSESKQEGRHAG